jgi:hypothetical protein
VHDTFQCSDLSVSVRFIVTANQCGARQKKKKQDKKEKMCRSFWIGQVNGPLPSKVSGPPRGDDLPLRLSHEHNGFNSWSFAIRKDTLRICGLVFVPRKHLVQTVVPVFIEEPFDVRARKPVQRVVAQRGVLH